MRMKSQEVFAMEIENIFVELSLLPML